MSNNKEFNNHNYSTKDSFWNNSLENCRKFSIEDIRKVVQYLRDEKRPVVLVDGSSFDINILRRRYYRGD